MIPCMKKTKMRFMLIVEMTMEAKMTVTMMTIRVMLMLPTMMQIALVKMILLNLLIDCCCYMSLNIHIFVVVNLLLYKPC